jgi:very-short-patch-repair endonuclease
VDTQQLFQIADRQHGAVSRRQLLDDVGVSASTVLRATKDGRLVQVAPGVYRVGGAPDTFEARCSAATLFGDGVGFVSGSSAGRLYGLRRMHADVVDFTVPDGFRTLPPWWMRLRTTNWYDGDEHRTLLEGRITVAAPLRMLFGLARQFNQRRFDNAADDAWQLGLITPHAALDFLQANRASGKNGVIRLERWVERALEQSAPSESYLERDLIAELERIGLPTLVRQYPLVLRTGERIRLDAAWPEIRLAVEPGHSWFHRFDGGQERDHRRDAACGELGWQILRLNEKMLLDVRSAARTVARVYRQRLAVFHSTGPAA